MSNCCECKHYIQELDVNYVGCAKDMEDKYWDCKGECPEFIDVSGGYDAD